MPATEQWIPVMEQSKLTPGTYRLLATFSGPYNGVTRAALKAGLYLQIASKGFKPTAFSSAAPLWNAHTNNYAAWPAFVRFEVPVPDPMMPVQAGIDGRSVVLLLAAVAGLALGLYVVSGKIERLIERVGDKLLKPILSPGTVVLVVLAIFLLTRAHVGKT